MKKYLLILLLLLFLSACSSAPTRISATPTPQLPASPLDGSWEGQGKTTDGKPFQVSLTVEGGTLTGVLYSFPGSDGEPCALIVNAQTASEKRPQIIDDEVTFDFGENLSGSASFRTDGTASGHLSIRWHNRPPHCYGDYEVDWKGTKQSLPAAQSSPQTPASHPHPIEIFLQIVVFGLSNGAVLALNAIGVTLIYSTVRTLNLAHGDVFALTTALVTSIVNAIGISLDWPPLQIAASLVIVLIAAMALGALLSVGVERLAFAPFRGHSRLAPLIATLGLSFILFQGALVWRTFQRSWIPGEHRSVPGLPEVPTDGIPSFLPEINLINAFHLPYHLIIRFSDVFVILMAILLVTLTTWFIQSTRSGRALRALSQNAMLAEMVGINVNGTIRSAFAIGGALAGAAGFIFALYYGRPFGSHGAQSGLFAFMAALLGGIGSAVGALVSGLLIGVFSSLSDYYLTAQWTPALLLALLLLLFLWKPAGFVSDESAADSAVVRDSVILAEAGQGSGVKRWFFIPIVLLALLPLILHSGQTILNITCVFILLTLGLNLALGVAGLLDLGFAVAFGLGAYVTALLSSKVDVLFILLLSASVGAFFGLLKGFIARRLRSDFFAVATLALGLLVRQVIINMDLFGGMGGIGGFAAPHFMNFILGSQSQRYYLMLGLVTLAAYISHQLIGSRTGRAWIALSEDELAASAAGVDVPRSRMLALLLSSAMAGIAGALYASTLSFVEPDLMAFHVSSMILTMVILGGAGNVTGAIIGAVTIVLYDKMIVPQFADWLALIWPANAAIGSAPDIRGASFFNFGIALYLTVLLRARRK